MSAVFETQSAPLRGPGLPLLGDARPGRVVVWHRSEAIDAGRFLAEVEALAEALPAGRHVVNLCEDRYAFLLAFAAAARRGQTTLLPPSRAPQAVDEALCAHADSYALGDQPLDPPPPGYVRLCDLLPAGTGRPTGEAVARIAADAVVAIGFTSGSTGQPKPNAKHWAGFNGSSAHNAALLASVLGLDGSQCAQIVATVPSQHMYGIETTVLLPLLGPFAVHGGRPFFPRDVAAALADVPAPRVLVTTPVHLATLLREGIELPPLGAIVSATAPLGAELAQAAEARFGAPLIELFGSTETCVIAHRRPALGDEWRLYPGLNLRPQPDGTVVDAPYFAEPVLLLDTVELLPERRFRLRGRNADLLEIAGKRASLSDLTRRLLALPGVHDGAVFQLDQADAAGVRRIAALVVAPERSEADLLTELRRAIDPVFLPRPLRKVAALPRNETGKLPRRALLAALDA